MRSRPLPRKEQSAEFKIWDRINEHEGKIRYQINRESPAISTLVNVLGENERKLLEIVLSQIECYLPKYSIANDNMDSLAIVNTGEDAEEEHLIEEIIEIIALCDEQDKAKTFEMIFMVEGYRRLEKRKEEVRRRVLGNG